MILTVTLNAAIDRTLSVPNFRLGRRHRSVESVTMPGGKGVNVARALKLLGEPVIATGLAGGMTGMQIVSQLTQEQILNDFVRIRDESRASSAVIDPMSNQQTEINEQGPAVTESELALFAEKLLYLAKGADVCIFSGSLPRGVPEDTYGDVIGELKQLGVITIVDCDGGSLRSAIRAEPTLVTPNRLEAEELVGHEFHDQDDCVLALEEMCAMGAREAVMTYEGGCYGYVGHGPDKDMLKATLESLEPVSTIGSGDVFLAGYVARRYRDRPRADCLRYAVACGAESTQHFGAGIIDRREVERLLPQVKLEEIAVAEESQVAK